MDTRNPMLASPSMRVVLGVGLLMSYEGMGTGLLECVRGCHCPVVHLDCHWDKPMSIKARHFPPTLHACRVCRFCNARCAEGPMWLARLALWDTACGAPQFSLA